MAPSSMFAAPSSIHAPTRFDDGARSFGDALNRCASAEIFSIRGAPDCIEAGFFTTSRAPTFIDAGSFRIDGARGPIDALSLCIYRATACADAQTRCMDSDPR